MKRILIVFILFIFPFVQAQENIKLMFYNVLEYPNANPENRALILKEILDDYTPDIFMICELQGEDGAEEILTQSLNYDSILYARAEYISNQSSGSNLQQMIYYRADKFSLELTDIIETSVRDINRYYLKLNTIDKEEDPIYLNVYVTHLKSSQGSQNENLRLEMVEALTNTFNELDPNSYVIFSGDFNVYSSTEPAYIEILDNSNDIVLVDPIDRLGSWHNNENYQDIHTQSTRISSGPFGAGAGGGLDDRFDFIMMSENMEDDPVLKYVEGTYKAFGNNGNCYNNNINDEFCTGEYSVNIREHLYQMSDHLPVVMEIETSKEFDLNSSEFVLKDFIQLKNTIVEDNLQFQISEEIGESIIISIYNSLGQLVILNQLDNYNTLISVSHLQSGIYYVSTNMTEGSPLKFLKK